MKLRNQIVLVLFSSWFAYELILFVNSDRKDVFSIVRSYPKFSNEALRIPEVPFICLSTGLKLKKSKYSIEAKKPLYLHLYFPKDEVIRDAGYPCETHKVQTEDGYILTVFRIPHGKEQEPGRRPAILLLHGVTASSDSFLISNTEYALAFVLSDSGYDVWLGNNRGNRYSLEHVNNTNVDMKKYWDFSFHELGYYDLPALVSHILNETKEEKIYLLGHSLGATISMVFLSERTEFQDKIQTVIALGPAVFIGRGTTILINLWCDKVQSTYAKILGSNFFPLSPIVSFLNYGRISCSPESTMSFFCEFLFELMNGLTSGGNQGRYTAVLKFWPTITSLRSITHLCQCMNTGHFQAFDHGEELNLAKYGSPEPPSYDLSKITTPVVLIFGASDAYVHVEDAYRLCTSLGHVAEYYRIPEPYFNHVDLILHPNSKTLVFDKIVEVMGLGPSLMNRKSVCENGTVKNVLHAGDA